MTKRFTYLALAGAVLGLAACDSSNDRDDLTEAVNSFGRVFAAAFYADPNTDVLVNPQPGDLRVDPTANPIDI